MLVFYALLVYSYIILYFYNRSNCKKNKFLLEILLISGFVILMGTRVVTSFSDEYNYRMNVINSIGTDLNFGKVFNLEGGMYLLTWLIGNIFRNDQVFIFVTSLIIYGLLIDSFLQYSKKNLNYFVFSIFILSGELLSSTNIIRQYIAVSIILYALRFFLNGKYKKFVALYIFSAWFHNSVIITIPILFVLLSKKITLKTYLYMLIIVFFFSSTSILEGFLENSVYSAYISNVGSSVSTLRTLFWIVQYFVLFLVYKLKKNIQLDLIYINAAIIALTFNISSMFFLYASRFTVYYEMIAIIGLPNILYLFVKRDRALISLIWWIIYFIFSYYTYVGVNYYQWVIF